MISLNDRITQLLISIVGDLQSRNNVHQSNITRLNQDGGHTIISFLSPVFATSELSLTISTNLDQICREITALKNASAKSNLIDFSIIRESIFRTVINSFLKAIQLNPNNTFAEFSRLAETEAQNIERWCKNQEEFAIRIRVYPEVNNPISKILVNTIGQWQQCRPDRFEMSLAAHQSGMAASEFLSRLQQSSYFISPLSRFPAPQNREVVVEQIELFVLALSLGLRCPINLDNIEVIPSLWGEAPLSPFNFSRRWGSYKSLGADSSTVQFFATVLSKRLRSISSYEIEVGEWLSLLQEVKSAYFPLRAIMDGVWRILAGQNEPNFIPSIMAKEGLLQICIGMDGLIRMTEGGITDDHRGKFQRAWKTIARSAGPLGQVKKHDGVVEKIYQLRCVLAHGGVDRVKTAVTSLKKKLGDDYNPGDYTELSCGFLFITWIFHVLDIFRNQPQMLKDLYDPKKIHRDNKKYIVKKIRFQISDLISNIGQLIKSIYIKNP